MAQVIGFSAWSGTGKTTMLEKVIRELKDRGFGVAAVKHDMHGIDPCEDGKDSARLRRAGAQSVTLIGPGAGEQPEKLLRDTLEALRTRRDVDIILVEGFKFAPIPRVGLCRAEANRPLPEPPENYIAVVSDADIAAPVPLFHWDEHRELTDFLAGRLAGKR